MTSYLRSSKYREEWADLAEGASDAGRVDLAVMSSIGVAKPDDGAEGIGTC